MNTTLYQLLNFSSKKYLFKNYLKIFSKNHRDQSFTASRVTGFSFKTFSTEDYLGYLIITC